MSKNGPRRRKRRLLLLDMLGNKCVQCGAEEELQFDHIDRSTKEFVLSGRGLDKSLKKIMDEVKKCQILCNTRHRAKTLREDKAIRKTQQ